MAYMACMSSESKSSNSLLVLVGDGERGPVVMMASVCLLTRLLLHGAGGRAAFAMRPAICSDCFLVQMSNWGMSSRCSGRHVTDTGT